METLIQDIRYGIRVLLRSRGFAAAAILTLALGIGANTAIFSVVNGVLLRPLPYDQPDRLVMLWYNNPAQGIEKDVTSAPTFLDWKQRNTVFGELAAFTAGYRNLTDVEEPERLSTGFVTEDFFTLLGVEPALGRGFTAEEHQPGGARVVILGHGIWSRRFGSDPAVVGRTVSINAEPHTVVGVAPPGFAYPEASEMWVPLAFSADEPRGALWLSVAGRLKDGVTLDQAQSQMNAIASDLAGEYPDLLAGTGVLLEPLADVEVGEVRPALLVLLGAVGFVLLIACANVANLLFARSTTRQKEIAIRIAVGAARGRVVRQVLTESVVLAMLGGGLGLLLATWGVPLLIAIAPADLPRLDEVGVDTTVLLATLAAAAFAGILFGLLPAIHASHPGITGTLRDGGRGATGGRRSGRMRQSIVAAEIALALVLLAGAGLMVRTVASLQAVDPGYRSDHVLTMRVSLPAAKYPENAQVSGFYDELVRTVQALPGVESASAVSTLLLNRLPNSAAIVVDGAPDMSEVDRNLPIPYDAVTPGYFASLGIDLVAGRGFTVQDDSRAPSVVMINQALARRFFPGEDPIGRRIAFGQPDSDDGWSTIVGVVEDVRRSGLDREARPETYFPHAQAPIRTMTLVVRTVTEPLALVGPIRRVVRTIDPDQPLSDIRTLEQALSETVATRRFSALLLSLFSVVAALLAAVGIYGLMAFSVAQRRREIGVRMALGANRGDVLRLVGRQALAHVLPGLGIGLIGAVALTRLLSGLLYGVTSTDPATFAGVALLLALVALLAGYLPADRATRVDPLMALKEE